MKCSRCQYQFCWLCLSDFYSEYHTKESLCPGRMMFIKMTVAILWAFFLCKLQYSSQISAYLVSTFVFGVISQLLAYVSTFLIWRTFWKFEIIYELLQKIKGFHWEHTADQDSVQTQKSKRFDIRPNLHRIKKTMIAEARAAFWMMVGIFIISTISRHFLALYFKELPTLIRKSVPFHLFVFGFRHKINKWFSYRDASVLQLD